MVHKCKFIVPCEYDGIDLEERMPCDVKIKSKLFRNLKKGDKFEVIADNGRHCRTAIVTVTSVQECSRGWFDGKRRWQVNGNYPWWFMLPVRATHDERTDLR